MHVTEHPTSITYLQHLHDDVLRCSQISLVSVFSVISLNIYPGAGIKQSETNENLFGHYFLSEYTSLFGPDTYILRTPPGWLSGILVLVIKSGRKSQKNKKR